MPDAQISDTPAHRRYIAVKFREGDRKTYTYHWDGTQTFPIGSTVKVPDRSGDGWNRVIVDGEVGKPPYATKAILGPHMPLTEGATGKLDLFDGAA